MGQLGLVLNSCLDLRTWGIPETIYAGRIPLLPSQSIADCSIFADKQYAVIAFLIELCETNCIDPFLASVFKYVEAISMPGNVTLTGPLYFEELMEQLLSQPIYK